MIMEFNREIVGERERGEFGTENERVESVNSV